MPMPVTHQILQVFANRTAMSQVVVMMQQRFEKSAVPRQL